VFINDRRSAVQTELTGDAACVQTEYLHVTSSADIPFARSVSVIRLHGRKQYISTW
jgi:hypothetical protein